MLSRYRFSFQKLSFWLARKSAEIQLGGKDLDCALFNNKNELWKRLNSVPHKITDSLALLIKQSLSEGHSKLCQS